MGMISFTAEVNDDVTYTTDDSGRLWAYVMGVLQGSGMSGGEAVIRANELTPQVTQQHRSAAAALPDGRTLHLRIHHRGE